MKTSAYMEKNQRIWDKVQKVIGVVEAQTLGKVTAYEMQVMRKHISDIYLVACK